MREGGYARGCVTRVIVVHVTSTLAIRWMLGFQSLAKEKARMPPTEAASGPPLYPIVSCQQTLRCAWKDGWVLLGV